MLRAVSLLLLLTALCGCRTTTPAAPPPRVNWEVPLLFEAGGRPSPLPLVQATVGGQPTLLLVDTGAAETTLQAWFVEALGVEASQADGLRVAAVPLRLGSAELSTVKWPIVESVKAFRDLGIGGTLSPQHVLAKGAVALDFPRRRLIALEGQANAWLRWLDERSPKGQVEALPRVSPRDGRLYVVTRVGDGREVATGLASGQAQTSYLAELFDPALLGEGGHVAGLQLRVGQSEFGPLDVLVHPAPSPSAGRLGMDVLAGVVVLVPVHELHPIWFMTPRE